MPEGDTIFRAARTLNRVLSGQVVTGFETQLPQLARVDDDSPITGRKVESVEALGKWIHMHFSGGLTLVTHMLMSGSWHLYRPGEAWQKGRQQMRIVIHTRNFVAVAFQVPIAEFHTSDTLRRHRSVLRLGPDVLSPEFDSARAAARLAAHSDLEVGTALLTQAIVAGMGNVFKSEVCFVSGVNPFRSVGSLTVDELNALMSQARTLLRANVTEASHLRRTTGRANPAERLWVYGRRGEPCRLCGAAILSRKQAPDARVTFWCPQCQPARYVQRGCT